MKKQKNLGFVSNKFYLDNLGRMIFNDQNILREISGAINISNKLDPEPLYDGMCPYFNASNCVNVNCNV